MITSVKLSALVNNLGVIAELIIGIVFVVGLIFIPHQTQPVSILFDTGGTVQNGDWLIPFIMGFLLPLYMIQSFDATGNAAEETHNASWTAPLGTFIANITAVFIGGFMFLLFNLAIPNVDEVVGNDTAGTLVVQSVFGVTLTHFIELIIFAALLACMVVLQLTAARLIWSQAREGEFIFSRFFKKVSVGKVPLNATLLTAIGSVGILAIGAFSERALDFLASFTALAWILAYGVLLLIGYYGLLAKKIPTRAFSLGRFSPYLFVLAIIWEMIACVLVVAHDPFKTVVGMIGAIALGSLLYALSHEERNYS